MKKRPDRQKPPEEQGAVVKRGKDLTRVALVYPNNYRAGMSSLGYQRVYQLANQMENIACERVFLPLPDKGSHAKSIKSLETGLSLDKFDIIMFSVSFENDFLHIAQLLRATGIPLRSSDRNHIHPLVVAGGVACFLNPEPIAPFIDLFLLGEAECLLPDFFYQFNTLDRARLLNTVEERVPGAYVPAHHHPILYSSHGKVSEKPARIQVQYLESLDRAQTNTSIMTDQTAFKDTFLIETLKGCPHGCRFCTAGFIYRPPRIYPIESIFNALDKACALTDKAGLVSSAVLDHPDIKAICEYGRKKGLALSFSSLRADKLDEPIIDILADSGVKTATIAPEAGSRRMRNIINKKLTEKDILAATGALVEKGIINLRLYFMIGLPFETDDDVKAIVDLTLKIKSVFLETARKKKRIGTITLSINPFIPKPCTPFQWSPMEDRAKLKKKVALIRQGLKKTANVNLNFESLRQARVHALLSLGDRKASDLIESALEDGWTRTMKTNKTYCDMVIHREKPQSRAEDAPALPWDILHHRVNDSFLSKELERAKKEKKSPACPMTRCEKCQICITPDRPQQ